MWNPVQNPLIIILLIFHFILFASHSYTVIFIIPTTAAFIFFNSFRHLTANISMPCSSHTLFLIA
jgi:hypothetical protein